MCLFFLNFSLILIASCLIAMFALLILAMRGDGLRRAEIFVLFCLFVYVCEKSLLNLARLFTEIKWNVTPFIAKHFNVTVRTGWNTSSPAVFQSHCHVLTLHKCEHKHGHGSSSSMGGTASIVYLIMSKEMHVNTVLSIPSIIPKKCALKENQLLISTLQMKQGWFLSTTTKNSLFISHLPGPLELHPDFELPKGSPLNNNISSLTLALSLALSFSVLPSVLI